MTRVLARPAPPRAQATVPLWLLGTSGMLAGEFLRLLDDHPGLHLAGAVSREPSVPLAELHPHLASGPTTLDLAAAAADMRAALAKRGARGALVLGLPHGRSAPAWKALRAELGEAAERLSVVDLSADYRLTRRSGSSSADSTAGQEAAADRRLRAAAACSYGGAHADADELDRFVYGLPEVHREEIAASARVAAPGCFATSLLLASLPAAAAGLLDETRPWSYSAVSGSSGSGIVPQPGTHHPHRHGNLWAYALDGHRHEAELRQGLASWDLKPPIVFIPHSGPFARGIHLTALLPLATDRSSADAFDVYRAFYAGEPFVEVLADGVPDLRRVVGSNKAAIAVRVRESTLVVLLTLDNLIKGGAGQALQGLNLMLGYPEGQGLPRLGLGVV